MVHAGLLHLLSPKKNVKNDATSFKNNARNSTGETTNFCRSLVQVSPMHPSDMTLHVNVRKNTVSMGQRALWYMRVFCICCRHKMSRMTQPPSKMTSELLQRCAKSSSENDAIISTPLSKYVAPLPLRILGAGHCKVGFCPWL